MTAQCGLRRDQEPTSYLVPVRATMPCSFLRLVEPTIAGGPEQVIRRDASGRPARSGRREERELRQKPCPGQSQRCS